MILLGITLFISSLIAALIFAIFRKGKTKLCLALSGIGILIFIIGAALTTNEPVSSEVMNEKDSNQATLQETKASNKEYENSEEIKSSGNPLKTTEESIPQQDSNLGITTKQLKEYFNENAANQNLDYYIDSFEIKDGEVNVDTFTKSITDSTGLLGTIDKQTQYIKMLRVLLVYDGQHQSFDDFTNIMGLSIMAIKSNISKDNVIKIVSDSVSSITSDDTKLESIIKQDGYIYKIARIKQGFFFSISKQ